MIFNTEQITNFESFIDNHRLLDFMEPTEYDNVVQTIYLDTIPKGNPIGQLISLLNQCSQQAAWDLESARSFLTIMMGTLSDFTNPVINTAMNNDRIMAHVSASTSNGDRFSVGMIL